ncbi:MAG: bifunctional folylpolyglutamate synthase/dihydrofolate synthase [Muribaculaceae bacterium]
MNYQETINYLYQHHPAFQQVGAPAYKAGLDTSLALDSLYQHPHTAYKCIHVAGTNGKGSVSHTLASILQHAGFRVGLYTSPHLVDLRERIRVNGQMITQQYVIDFMQDFIHRQFDGNPSFFELTMTMAFNYFRDQKVDFAVIEVGLGGRLDSTNILQPMLSVITNISFDHTQILGNTLTAIATEKAGIIKRHTPVVIGEAQGDVRTVFANAAATMQAPIIFAEDNNEVVQSTNHGFTVNYCTRHFGNITSPLAGDYQVNNINTLLHAVAQLQKMGVNIPTEAIEKGIENVCSATGLMGRWMKLADSPLTLCDTAHNIAGFSYVARQLKLINCTRLHIVVGFVNDKDIDHILDMLPKQATYYFTQAHIPRAQAASIIAQQARDKGLIGQHYPTVESAYNAALSQAAPTDAIYVGGSSYIVADLLSMLGFSR